MSRDPVRPIVSIDYPEWVDAVVDWEKPYETDEERMRLAIAVARENVEQGTGGPFGAAIFEASGAHVGRVADELSRRLGKEISLQVDVDPRILGGLKLQYGDHLVDASVATRLQKLRRSLAAS